MSAPGLKIKFSGPAQGMRLFLALLPAVSLPAATYYVATDGSDANNGTSTNTPFASPQKAVTATLAPGRQLIDKGANVGRPFNGSAPDLGAFEFGTAVSQPQPLALSGAGIINGAFQFTISGLTAPGHIIVRASSKLTTWTPIFTNPPVSGSWQFTDSNTFANPKHFYRTEEQ